MNRPTIRKAKKIYRLLEKAEKLENLALQRQLEIHSSTVEKQRLDVAMEGVKKEVAHREAFKCLKIANELMGEKYEGLSYPEEYGHELTVSLYINHTKDKHALYGLEAICRPSFPRRAMENILDVLGL